MGNLNIFCCKRNSHFLLIGCLIIFPPLPTFLVNGYWRYCTKCSMEWFVWAWEPSGQLNPLTWYIFLLTDKPWSINMRRGSEPVAQISGTHILLEQIQLKTGSSIPKFRFARVEQVNWAWSVRSTHMMMAHCAFGDKWLKIEVQQPLVVFAFSNFMATVPDTTWDLNWHTGLWKYGPEIPAQSLTMSVALTHFEQTLTSARRSLSSRSPAWWSRSSGQAADRSTLAGGRPQHCSGLCWGCSQHIIIHNFSGEGISLFTLLSVSCWNVLSLSIAVDSVTLFCFHTWYLAWSSPSESWFIWDAPLSDLFEQHFINLNRSLYAMDRWLNNIASTISSRAGTHSFIE